MNREQVRFLVSGILFGFLVGYIIAYAVHEPRVKQRAAPVPAAGNLGMSPGGVTGGGVAAPSGAGPGGEELMARVFEEIAALQAAIDQNPDDATALIRLANLFQDSGKYDEAIGYYERVLDHNDHDVNARTDMAICMRELGRTDEAIQQLRTSLTHDPKHWQTWLNLGIVSLFDKNDVESAATAFARLEEINPGYRDLPLLNQALRKAKGAGSQQAD